MSIMHKEKNEYEIDMNVANEMLQNVFQAVGQAPNSIPFDKLVLRQKARTGHLILAKTIAIAALLVTFIMPVAFCGVLQDSDNPVIVNDYKENGLLWLELHDDSTGIDYRNIYAKEENGRILLPQQIDRRHNLAAFSTGDKSLNIYISDYAGNITHAVYTSNN